MRQTWSRIKASSSDKRRTVPPSGPLVVVGGGGDSAMRRESAVLVVQEAGRGGEMGGWKRERFACYATRLAVALTLKTKKLLLNQLPVRVRGCVERKTGFSRDLQGYYGMHRSVLSFQRSWKSRSTSWAMAWKGENAVLTTQGFVLFAFSCSIFCLV